MGKLLVVMVVALFLGFMIEALVEYLIAPWFDNFPKFTKWKWLQMYVAMAVGLVAAFIYQLDLVNLLSRFLSETTGSGEFIPITTFGLIITGIAIGRGSNFLHDIFTKFFTKNATEIVDPTTASTVG